MSVATPGHKFIFPVGLSHHPLSEILVWNKEDFAIFWHSVDDLHRIPTCANDITESFDFRGAIYIGYYIDVRVILAV